MIKKELKIVEKLPRVQVGNILNVFWTNGSYEKPSNPIPKEEIEKNFIDLIVKIDWGESDVGTVKLSGKFNYLVYKGGEFFFLNPIRIVDIKKEIFVYSVVKDVSMMLINSPSVTLKGTLTKTYNEDILIKNLDYTKPLIDDYDEEIYIPMNSTDRLVYKEKSYTPINFEKYLSVKVFSTSKLAWILGHLTSPDLKDVIKDLIEEKGTTKLIFNCEFDELIPNKEVIDELNNWLTSGNLVLGETDEKSTFLDAYSCKIPLSKELEKWPKIYVLSEARSSLEPEQTVNIIKFTESEGKEIPSDYFENVNMVTYLNSKTLEVELLSNKHIFDMLPDKPFIEDLVDVNKPYELLPKVYTDVDDIEYSDYQVINSLEYNASFQELKKINHLNDEEEITDKKGKSIITSLKVNYNPSWWYLSSWDRENFSQLQESIKDKIPMAGFILFDLFHSFSQDFDKKFMCMNMSETTYDYVFVVVGLRFYDENDKDSEIDLLAERMDESDESYTKQKPFQRSEKNKINFGLVTSQQCKLLNNVLDVFSTYTMSVLSLSIDEGAYTQIPTNFKATFITTFKEDNKIITSSAIDLVTGDDTSIIDVKKSELFEHSYSNYDKIRRISTITKRLMLPRTIKKGDLFWSNVSWGFYNRQLTRNLNINKTIFALLVAPANDLTGKFSYRFSKITPHDIDAKIAKEDNVISLADARQTDKSSELYPWILHEEKYFLPKYEASYKTVEQQHTNRRCNQLYKVIDDFIDFIKSQLYVYPSNDPSEKSESEYYKEYNTVNVLVPGQYKYYEKRKNVIIAGKKDSQGLVIKEAIPESEKAKWYYFYNSPTWHCWYDGYQGLYNKSVETFRSQIKAYVTKNCTSQKIMTIENNFTSQIKDISTGKITYMEHPSFVFKHGQIVFAEVWFYGFNISNKFYRYISYFINKIEEIIKKWNEVEWEYEDRLHPRKQFDDSQIYERIAGSFSPEIESLPEFKKLIQTQAWNERFVTEQGRELSGNLSLTLRRIYQLNGNSENAKFTQKDFQVYWTDVTLDYMKKQYKSTELHIFKLQNKISEKEITDKGFLLMQWNEKEKKFLTQVIITDSNSIKTKHKEIVTPKEGVIKNDNLLQCINQKNLFYAYGHKIPVKGKLFKPKIDYPFEIYVSGLSSSSNAVNKFRVYIKTKVEIIDTKVAVPKRNVTLGQNVVSYIDLEKLKIDISEREENKSLNIRAADERRRLLWQRYDNAVEEYNFQKVIQPFRIANSFIDNLSRATRFMNPSKDLSSFTNITAGLLLGSAVLRLPIDITQHVHNMQVAWRDIEQMDRSNAFTIAHEKDTLDSKHRHEEMREKIKIMEMNSNYTDTNLGEDDEEIKNTSDLLFGDKDVKYGFIHYRPKRDGILIKYIADFYSRHGVDVFINDFSISMDEIIDSDISIWKFDSISEINIVNHSTSQKIRSMFINAVRFTKITYKFENAKFRHDQSYIIKRKLDEKRKIDETKLLLQARSELDEDSREQVRLAKEDLDTANALYQQLEKEKEECDAKVVELQEKVDKENTTVLTEELEKTKKELEKHKDSASLLSEQKMALEEEKTALTNQLTLEKRKVESANQQVVNAGAKNLDLVRKLAAANTAKTQAIREKEQCNKEKEECGSALELLRIELKDEKEELERMKKEMKELEDKEKVVCVDMSEDDVFNDYVNRIENLIQYMTDEWKAIFQQFTNEGDAYTYLEFIVSGVNKGYQYARDLNIFVGPSGVYFSRTDGENIYQYISGVSFLSGCVILYKDNTVNGSKAYIYDNFVYHPPFCLLKHMTVLQTKSYVGFYARLVSAFGGESRYDYNFLSSTKGHFLCSLFGKFMTLHREYIRLCKQFKQWESQKDYLKNKKIETINGGDWEDKFTSSKKVKFDKLIYFNSTHISS